MNIIQTPTGYRATVTQVLRLHPDMEAFRVQFGARETELDDLFRLALQIEGNV